MHLSRSSVAIVALLAGCPGTRTAGTVACPQDRTVVLAGQEDVTRHAACTSLGSLTIRTGASLDLSPMNALETITGDLDVGPTVGVDEVKLSELREVGGTVRMASNSSLHGVFLPRLERAGRVEIEANASLTTIAVPRLETVLGSLLIDGNGLLEVIDLSAVVTIGKDLVITDNPALTLIEGGKLETVQDIRIERNRKLPPDQLQSLRAATPQP